MYSGTIIKYKEHQADLIQVSFKRITEFSLTMENESIILGVLCQNLTILNACQRAWIT